MDKVFTIGVYGSVEATFFDALQRAGIDTFVDIRRRRGLRGSLYSYANAARLQEKLAAAGIRYIHLLELAPDEELRGRQDTADKALKVGKRQRERLDGGYIAEFNSRLLAPLDADDIAVKIGPDARNVVLFCVERFPAACHRSLVAGWLAGELGLVVEDLFP